MVEAAEGEAMEEAAEFEAAAVVPWVWASSKLGDAAQEAASVAVAAAAEAAAVTAVASTAAAASAAALALLAAAFLSFLSLLNSLRFAMVDGVRS